MLISILTDSGCGGTFLNWSLHYLAGHNEYYSVHPLGWMPVTDNPITDRNAHGFKPNQFNRMQDPTLEVCKSKIDLLKSVSTDQFHSLYFHDFSHSVTLNDSAVKLIEPQSNKVVVVDAYQYPLYYSTYKKRHANTKILGIDILQADDAFFESMVSTYFKESAEIWNNLNLSEVWDKREFIALNFHPFKERNNKLSKPDNYYFIDGMELWTIFDTGVRDLFKYLELDIVEDRFKYWEPIYHTWRKKHVNNIQFSIYFNTIIKNILNGTYMDLTRFDLDIIQEATIQHQLLYGHNLNLKTWQLTKFIDTMQLHNLLEPNIYHKLNG